MIFVADSDPEKIDENIESYANLIENLTEYGKDIRELPHVIQYNKRDLPNAMPVAELDKRLNKFGVPTFEAVAYTGEGVFPTLKTLAAMVLESIDKIDGRNPRKSVGAKAPAAAAAPAGRPALQAAPPGKAPPQARPPAGRPAAPAPAPAGSRGAAPALLRKPVAAAGRPAPAAGRPGHAPAHRRVAATPVTAPPVARKRGGFGVLVALTVLLLVAAAGVAYLFLGNQGG